MNRDVSDPGRHLSAWQGETLLQCPRCAGPGVSRLEDPEANHLFASRRFTCSRCALVRHWSGNHIQRMDGRLAVDDYFHFPLWLQITCEQGVVWVYNEQHLNALSDWIGSPLRRRKPNPVTGWSNGSHFSRLPAWMKSARHRKLVLQAVNRLRRKLKNEDA